MGAEAFADANTELEQLATDALTAPRQYPMHEPRRDVNGVES